MSKRFDSGYALLIGVNENAVTRWSLPEVVKDIDALRSIFIHPERCAYPVDHLIVLTGKQATRDNILDGLARLRDKVAADKSANATAVIYYSGHGWRDAEQAPPDYYLIPCNVSEHQLRSRALRASDFAAGINELEARRLLVILDCCHAGGMGVKGVSPEGFASAAVPPRLFTGKEKTIAAADGSKGLEDLATGSGRAVISSSQANQPSYMRRDGKMSIFTYHLIEALTGHAKSDEKATEVLVTDIMSHVHRQVPISAGADWNREQRPDYQLSGNFPVGLLLGGKGMPKGVRAPDLLGLTGFTQRSQVAHGPQTNIGGNVQGDILYGDFNGPVSVGGNAVDMRGSRETTYIRTFKGGFFQPNLTAGGNIYQSDRDIVMGDRPQAARDIDQTLTMHFSEVFKKVAALPEKDQRLVKRAVETVRDQVMELQQIGLGDETSPKAAALRKGLKTLVDRVPVIADAVLEILQNPTKGIVKGVRKAAERIKAETTGR